MINCIIIDDDATARLIVRQLCIKTEKMHIAKEFSSAIDAIRYLNSTSVDIIFLDIHMPMFSGIDFVKSFKDLNKIILTTSDKNFAIEAFEYDCIIDYLLKPISQDRFEKTFQKICSFGTNAIQEVETIKNTEKDFIYVNIEKRLVKINISEIYLIEAKGDYISIKTKSKSYIVLSTLKKIEEKLPKSLFLRVHRSFIINTSEIIDIEDNSVLINEKVIPVSRSNKSELIRRLNLL